MIPPKLRLKNTIKYPTTLIVGGLNKLGLEIADSLIKQGGYVVIVDSVTRENVEKFDIFEDNAMISFLDFTAIPQLEEDIRRLDYVFYFAHESIDFRNEVSTQEFLTFSNYIDATLILAVKFDARFLLTTSIKAQQIFYSEKHLGFDVNMGQTMVQAYTDMEVQRYAEGLTSEYNEKAGLNTRIVRLGEIIGDGMDFGVRTAFVDLVLSAVRSQNLILRNDGLENEWFVHVLDAAYGLIKAQFSKDTAGKFYSVSYDNTYTHLSIAYKIQEIEEDAREIQFASSSTMAPPIKIHKPAPNLSDIGWMPRVSFDKAVRQSLAAAKVELIEKGLRNLPGNNKVNAYSSGYGTDSENVSEMIVSGGGNSPVSSMIAQKKQEEALRRQRIRSADQSIRKKRNVRQMSFSQRIQNFFWGIFIGFSSIFVFFRKKSPVEAGLILFFGLVFIGLYFVVISPMLLVVRNGLILYPEYQSLKSDLVQSDYASAQSRSEKMTGLLQETDETLGRFDFIFNFFTLDEELLEFRQLIRNYSLTTDAIADISESISPYNEYLESLSNNTQLRNSSETYLSTSDTGDDYSAILSKITEREALLRNGIDKYEKSASNLSETDYSLLPTFIGNRVLNINKELSVFENSVGSSINYKYIPELLGVGDSKTYLLLNLDNTRVTPIGGDIASFAIVQLTNGSVSEVIVQSPEDVQFDLSGIDENDIREINNRRFAAERSSELTYNSITTANNFKSFANLSTQVWSDSLDTEIDGVFVVNSEAIDSLLTDLRFTNDLQVNNTQIQGGNYLSHIKTAQSGTETLQNKKIIQSQVLAYIVNQSIFEMVKNYGDFETSLFEAASAQNIYATTPNLDFESFLVEKDINQSNYLNTESFASVGILLKDSKIVNLDKFPGASLSMVSTINNDYSINNNLKITFQNPGAIQEISICFSEFALASTIKFDSTTIDLARTAINSDGQDTCAVAQTISENTLQLSWKTSPNIAENATEAIISLAVPKIRGVQTNLDYTININENLMVKEYESTIAPIGSNLSFSSPITRDFIIDLELSK